MRLTLAVIGLATATFAQQEFIPIGGGSGRIPGPPRGASPEFGENFTPTIIDPNDPSFQPANIAGNRPNPIALFPKSQQAGTPHEAPVDFTFVHQHSYKEPFRNDQFIGILHNPIGAARPNIPRTLGRENIYIDPRTIANSEFAKAEDAKRNKNMMFFGLAPPVEKLHRADEFAPSSVQFQKPWDQWYDRFTEAPALPRRQSPLTQTKRPNIVDIPFYAADRGKRDVVSIETTAGTTTESTTSAPSTTTILSDAIGSSTATAALETTTAGDSAAVIGTTTSIEADLTTTTTTTTPAPAASTTTAAAASTTVATLTSSTTVASTAASSSTTTAAPAATAKTSTAAPAVTASHNAAVVTATTTQDLGNVTSNTPIPSTGPVIPFRVRNRKPLNSTTKPTTVKQQLRSLRTKVSRAQNRTTLAVQKTTPTPTNHTLLPLKLDSAIGAATNSSRAATTKLPIRTTTLKRRPHGKSHLPLLRRLLNNTTTTDASKTTTSAASAAVTAATTPTTVKTQLKALNRTNATTVARSKAPFRIFSKRPLNASKLPARTPIQEAPKPSAITSNNIGELRTEVNRLLSTVVQLQSTVISQQQRIALLENQLRLRRSTGRKLAGKKTTRFIAPNGKMVERTMIDVRKGRSIKLRNIAAQTNLRQSSRIA